METDQGTPENPTPLTRDPEEEAVLENRAERERKEQEDQELTDAEKARVREMQDVTGPFQERSHDQNNK